MEGEDRHLFKVEHFTGDNYVPWRFRMENHLKKKDYWSVDDGSEQNAEKNAKALIDINLSVGDDQIVYVQDARSAKEAWERLARVYANEGIANWL
jgi:hypothetical protein